MSVVLNCVASLLAPPLCSADCRALEAGRGVVISGENYCEAFKYLGKWANIWETQRPTKINKMHAH